MLKVTTPVEFYRKVKTLDHFTVKFVNRNGEERLMYCTANMENIPKISLPKSGKPSKTKLHLLYNQILRVFDIKKQAWRTIPLDRTSRLFIRGKSWRVSIPKK